MVKEPISSYKLSDHHLGLRIRDNEFVDLGYAFHADQDHKPFVSFCEKLNSVINQIHPGLIFEYSRCYDGPYRQDSMLNIITSEYHTDIDLVDFTLQLTNLLFTKKQLTTCLPFFDIKSNCITFENMIPPLFLFTQFHIKTS